MTRAGGRGLLCRLMPLVMVTVVAGSTPSRVASAASAPIVRVALAEWSVTPKPKTVSAGHTRFVVKNAGYSLHELVIVRARTPDALPTNADGSVAEDQIAPADRVGAVDDVASKHSRRTTFRLSPGRYVLFCNIVEEGHFSHFAEHMVNTLRVDASGR